MIKAVRHLFFFSWWTERLLRFYQVGLSTSSWSKWFLFPLVHVITLLFDYRRATKKLVFLVWCTKSSYVFFLSHLLFAVRRCVVHFFHSKAAYLQSLHNITLIRKRLILSLNHPNEDWQMIPYLATYLLRDLQQTPELCAAAFTGCRRSCRWSLFVHG